MALRPFPARYSPVPNASRTASRGSCPDRPLFLGILASQKPYDRVSEIHMRRRMDARDPFRNLLVETGALFNIAIKGTRHLTPLVTLRGRYNGFVTV